MKSYSKADILNELEANQNRSLFNKFIRINRLVKVTISRQDFVRGKVFCDDMKERFGNDLRRFKIDELFYVLYKDFLEQIREGLHHKDIANYLAKGKEKHFPKKVIETEKLVQVRKNQFKFNNTVRYIEDELDENLVTLHISMREKELLRGEIILSDLEQIIGEYNITVEEILVILYLEFIDSLKKHGTSKSIQQSIFAMK